MKKFLFMMIPVFAFAGLNAQEKIPALDMTNFDKQVSPAVDFYQYVNGGWQKKNPLKPEYARFGTFDIINENNEKRINSLFSEMTKMNPQKGTVEQKISDLYKMGLDSVKLNAEGAKPIAKYLKHFNAIKSNEDLVKQVASMHSTGSGYPFFWASVGPDMENVDIQILSIGQSGLGIGDRDYYLDPANAKLKEGYRNFLVKIFTLSNVKDPSKKADNALKVEDALAKISWTSVQERDVQKQYNPMTTAQLEAKYPHIGFATYFKFRGIADQEKLIVSEPSFFAGLDSIMASTPTSVLRDYVEGQFISDACGALSDDFTTASFDFFSKQMSGVQQQKPRWKRAMAIPNSILGEAVGKMYVEKYFPESSKQKMVALVDNLRASLADHIKNLQWMGDQTKQKALEKLANFTVKIGYPDKWKDYSTMDIDPSKSYYENLRNASIWYVNDNMSKLGKAPDRSEWHMTPQTVNAYYNPTTNEICFPAAILQPPFFNPDADDAVNYGAIGVVICHEMTHGFDDEGRLFDKVGNMTNWWTEADAAKFKEMTAALAKQFDQIQVVPGVMANGELTLGENIADHGGLSIAYSALEKAIKGNRPGLIDGFTPEQRFYLSYASVWADNITDAEKARRTKLDPHSLGKNRVNMSLRNFDSFFTAFGIKAGDPMFRPESERVHIW